MGIFLIVLGGLIVAGSVWGLANYLESRQDKPMPTDAWTYIWQNPGYVFGMSVLGIGGFFIVQGLSKL